MPIYEYTCLACGIRQESFRSMDNRDNPRPCEICSQETVRCITTVQIKLEPFTGAFPSACAKWERSHKEQLTKEQKFERDNGPIEY